MSGWQRSSFCSYGACVEVAWQRSTRCSIGDCVETHVHDDEVWVRDSKHPDREPLVFSRDEWAAFVAGVKADEFKDVPR